MAVLILLYLLMGFGGASWLKSGMGGSASMIPIPLWERLLPNAAVVALLALPLLGYKQASKRGEFLRMSPGMWIAMPLVAVLAGVAMGFYF